MSFHFKNKFLAALFLLLFYESSSHLSLVTVKAVAIKHLDKSRATGGHYSSLAPKEGGRVVGGDGSFTNRVRYVSVGSMAGDLIQLSAANLRSVDLQLMGSGLGAWSRSQVGELFSDILPEMFRLAVAGGQRLVVTI